SISDGHSGTASASVSVRVGNHAPVAADDGYSVLAGHTLNVAAAGVLANDTDADGDALTAALAGGPGHGSVAMQANGAFTYTPETGYRGSDSFSYTASDGFATSNVATVTITVANNPPVARNDSASTPQDAAVTVDVLANDSDPDDDPLTISAVTQGANGSVAIVGSQVRYTPNSGYAGTDSFTYTVSDGHGGTATATVTVTVAGDNGQW